MNRVFRRLLAALLVMLMAIACFAPMAVAQEDWRSLLRDVFGLSDDGSYDNWSDDEYASEAPITDPQGIVNYIEAYGWLPDNFITKAEAREKGWDSSSNYVGEAAPDMSIGGDKFGNYEGLLPSKKGRTWYECDANYAGRKRGADRVLFSSDGLYYFTSDHYETFTQMFPED